MKTNLMRARVWKLCVAALLLFVVNVAANAYSFSVRNDDGVTIYYNRSGSEATVTYMNTNYNSYSGNVVIPDSVTYDGKTYTVVSIGNNAFSNITGSTSVTIPNSVTTIDEYAFYQSSGLTQVTIGEGVTTIGRWAFQSCSGLTEITIPNSVTEIGNYAFSGCSGLTSVTIGNSVTTIGTEAFRNCSGLTSVTIGNSVETIGSYAFYHCTSLTSVTIPNNVATIGTLAFAGCTGLTTLIIEDGEETLTVTGAAMSGCPIETLYLGRNIYYGGSSLFSDALVSLTIGENVTSIGNYLFSGCSGLSELTIERGSIGKYAFQDCTGLTELTLGGNVTSIDNSSFSGCTGMKKLTLKYGDEPLAFTTSSSSSPFSSFPLETLYLDRALSYSDSYSLFRDMTTLESLTIGENITTIEDYEFYGCSGINQMDFPDNITAIGDYAFYGCKGMEQVDFSDNITTIGNYAFYNCTGLTGTLTISNGITSIGSYAFYKCTGLTRLAFGESVSHIGDCAFSGCTGLVGKLTIPESVTTIGSSAFNGCMGLTSLTIGNNVISIGSSAFYNCTGLLGNLTIPNSVTSMGSYAFYGCSELTGELVIPDGVTAIENYTFYNCSGFSGLTIGEGVTSIGNYAFYGCTDLEGELTIPNQTNTIGSYAFSGCSKLTNLTIGGSVTSINDYAFKGCSGVIKIVIEDGESALSLTTNYDCLPFEDCPTDTLYIGRELSYSNSSYPAFAGRKIKSLTIGDNVTFIASKEFQSCSSLTDLTIGSSVETIGSRAFAYCYALTDVTIPESVETIGSEAFYKCTLTVLYLYARLDSYKDPFTNMSCKTIYAHRDQIEEIQKYWSGTVLPLEMGYTLSVVSVYPRSVILAVVENEGLCNDATIERIEVDGQTVTADKDGLYVATDLMPNTSYVCKLYYNSMGSDYTDEAVVTTENFADEVALQKVATQSVTFSITLNEDAYSSMPDEYGFMLGSTYYPADEDGTVTITGLEAETEYTFTAYAKYSDAVAEGESVTVTTQEFVVPTVETREATDVTSESATLHGFVEAGSEEILECGFEYWGTNDIAKTVVVAEGDMSATLTGLTPNVTYGFRAYAKTESGTTRSANMSFTTTPIPPTVQTYEATEVTENSALLSGYVEAGSETIRERGFEFWKPDGKVEIVTVSGNDISATINGLTEGTEYSYRAYATTTKLGTTYGETLTFTTLVTPTVTPPTVQTYAATNVTESSALLSGYVEAGSEDLQVKGFEYWAEGGEIRASGMAIELPMELNLAGLDHGTTYTYRAYAETASGKTYGENVSFTTLTPTVTPPTVQTYAATEVTDISATLNGVITTGDEEILEHGFEYWSEGGEIQSITTRNQSMTVTLTELMPDTKYTYRAYAKTESGTTYGVEVTFTTLYDLASVYAELEEAIEEMNDDLKAAWKTITTDYPDAEDDCMDYYDAIFDKVMDLIDMLDSNYRKGTLYADVVEEIWSGIAEGERMIEEMLAAAKKVHETGIEDILANCGDDARIYNLAGSRVHRIERGNVYIIRYSDGSTKKVLVK